MSLSQLIGKEPDPQAAFQLAEECQDMLDRHQRHDSPRHRTVEDGRIHDRGDRRQAGLHDRTVERKLQIIRRLWNLEMPLR